MSELRDVPGRERDLEQLVGVCRRVAEHGGGGHVVFVAGGPSSGREELLRALAKQPTSSRRGPVVLAGRFLDGRYVPDAEDPSARRRVLQQLKRLGEAGEWIAGTLGDVGVPYGGLVAQVLARTARPLELLEGLSARPEPLELAPRVLTRLCRRAPVAAVIDDADLADGGLLWADLILGLADRVARRLPLALILGMNGPQHLGDHEDDEPASLYVARQLTADGRASWHPLLPIGREELRRFTGPASADVLASLLAITEGEPALAGALWREWQRDEVVEDVSSAGWRFAGGRRDAPFDEVDAVLGERLKCLIGEDLKQLEHARKVLACAALKGQRFTAAAIADALQVDPDELIDFVDETLIASDEHLDGLLVENGWMEVRDERGSRSLAMYKFVRSIDRMTLVHHGFAEDQHRRLAQRLADGLASHYGGKAHRVAHTLVRLYSIAGDSHRADYYRRMADIGTNRQLMLLLARSVLAGEEATDQRERRRAPQILIAAAEALLPSGPFLEGVVFAQAAHRLATLRQDQAKALYFAGCHWAKRGDVGPARQNLSEALGLWRESSDRYGEASARNALATIDLERQEYEPARAELTKVLQLRREVGDQKGELVTRQSLASIDVEQEKYDAARDELAKVVELHQERGDREGEASARYVLAEIDLRQRRYPKAKAELVDVLRLRRELHDRDGEARTRHALASIDLGLGRYPAAMEEFVRVLELCVELGSRHGEAATRYQIGLVLFKQGKGREARRELERSVALCREVGDRDHEELARRLLAQIDDAEAGEN